MTKKQRRRRYGFGFHRDWQSYLTTEERVAMRVLDNQIANYAESARHARRVRAMIQNRATARAGYAKREV